MKQFKIGQVVVAPNDKTGKIKQIDGSTATVWFDETGNDVGIYSIPSLKYPPTTVKIVKG